MLNNKQILNFLNTCPTLDAKLDLSYDMCTITLKLTDSYSIEFCKYNTISESTSMYLNIYKKSNNNNFSFDSLIFRMDIPKEIELDVNYLVTYRAKTYVSLKIDEIDSALSIENSPNKA